MADGEGEGSAGGAFDHQAVAALAYADDVSDACERDVHDLVEPCAAQGGDHARREMLPAGGRARR
ncbi:hypothetical protein ACH4UM_02915 [Streptomyces sp. NPDC020801]|uniref:hypothetical protein n=1 Tax=Streptomyces sp. NPDC020801 TaxID=3365093 RepID=UPI0037A443E4